MTRHAIGERLRAVRSLRRLTQRQLGRPAGLTKEMVCKIECGDRELSFAEAGCFAQVLCISLDALYRTGPDGLWDITACLLPFTAPPQEEEDEHGGL